MKICIINRLFDPYVIGGGEIYAANLAKALKDADNDVTVITTRPFRRLNSLFYDAEACNGYKIYRFYPLNLYNTFFSKRRKIPTFLKIIWHIIDTFNIHSFLVVLIILKKEKPDVIHIQGLEGLSCLVIWTAKLLNIPVIYTLHSYHLLCPYATFNCPYSKFKRCLERPFICSFYSFFKKVIIDNIPRVVICPSRFIKDVFVRYRFFSKKISIVVLPNFIEPYQMTINNKDNKKDSLDLLYVGRLSKEKGVDDLLSSFKELKEDFLRLHIVGEGEELEKIKESVKGDYRVSFYGFKEKKDLAQFYFNSDILVVPSIWDENFPTVILESFSYGVPVIGSKIGGIPEIIENGRNGFLFTPGDRNDLCQKVKIFIEDFQSERTLLKNFSKCAYESSKKYYKTVIISQLMNIYASIEFKKQKYS